MTLLLAKWWLWITGFKVVGTASEVAKYVVIAAPHTSNWDLPHALAAARVLGVSVHWVGKHTLFSWPLGWLMRRLGGIAVDRRAAHGMVEQLAERFRQADRLVLLVPPEGTRSPAKLWKSGFYHIAKAAQVPIACSFVDYGRKQSGIGPLILPSDDIRADMDKVRAFYADIRGRYPQNETVPRLKEESAN